VQSIPFRECGVQDTCLCMFALTSKPILCPWVNVSITDCAGSPNNRALIFHSATHMSAQPLCDRLVLVPGRYRFAHFSPFPRRPHLYTKLCSYLSISWHLFQTVASTKITFTIGTCGNLAVLQYTLRIQYLPVMCHPSSVRAVQIFDFEMEAISGATKLDFNNSLFRLPETLNGSGLN